MRKKKKFSKNEIHLNIIVCREMPPNNDKSEWRMAYFIVGCAHCCVVIFKFCCSFVFQSLLFLSQSKNEICIHSTERLKSQFTKLMIPLIAIVIVVLVFNYVICTEIKIHYSNVSPTATVYLFIYYFDTWCATAASAFVFYFNDLWSSMNYETVATGAEDERKTKYFSIDVSTKFWFVLTLLSNRTEKLKNKWAENDKQWKLFKDRTTTSTNCRMNAISLNCEMICVLRKDEKKKPSFIENTICFYIDLRIFNNCESWYFMCLTI